MGPSDKECEVPYLSPCSNTAWHIHITLIENWLIEVKCSFFPHPFSDKHFEDRQSNWGGRHMFLTI